jgi:peptidoglycan/LPS O-acetylase OafA/YrhL
VGFSFSLGLLLQRRLRHVRLPSLPAPLLLVLLALALCAAPPASLRVFYELAFVAVLSPALILLGARAHPGLMRLCAFLGFLSYPLYALHNPILDVSNGALRRLHLSAPLPLLVIIGMVAALILVAWVAGHADAAIRKRLLSRLGLPQRAPYRLMQAT